MAGTRTHRILAFALSVVERNRLNIRKGYRILKMVNAVKTEQGTQVPGARGGSEGDIVLTGMVVVEIEMPSEPRLEGDKARKSE